MAWLTLVKGAAHYSMFSWIFILSFLDTDIDIPPKRRVGFDVQFLGCGTDKQPPNFFRAAFRDNNKEIVAIVSNYF